MFPGNGLFLTGRDNRAAPTEAAMLGAAFGALPIMQTPPTARWLFFSPRLENNHRGRFTRFIAPVILALMLFSACTRSHNQRRTWGLLVAPGASFGSLIVPLYLSLRFALLDGFLRFALLDGGNNSCPFLYNGLHISYNASLNIEILCCTDRFKP